MKKIFVAMLALAAATACSNDEIVNVNREAIGFDNAFINNSVRSVNDPSYTDTNLFADFAVYGYVEGATLFDGTTVSKAITNSELESAWKYEGTQYWIAGADYKFYAVAPMTNGGWSVKTGTTPSHDGATLSFTTTDGNQDLLYAPIVTREGANNDYSAVAFTFQHILSKVKFSFKNGYNASAATIKVKNIKITNPYKTGEVALAAAATWSEQAVAEDFTLNFGMATDAEETADKENIEVAYAYGKTYESQNERLLIPGNKEWEISFVVELLVSGKKIDEYEHTAKATIDFQPGHSYNINAEITASNIDPEHAQEPIEFTVTPISDWANGNTADSDDDNVNDSLPLPLN